MYNHQVSTQVIKIKMSFACLHTNAFLKALSVELTFKLGICRLFIALCKNAVNNEHSTYCVK